MIFGIIVHGFLMKMCQLQLMIAIMGRLNILLELFNDWTFVMKYNLFQKTPHAIIKMATLQFWPKTAAAKSSFHYTGKFNSISGDDHSDQQLATGIFVRLHNKDKVEVGETNYPVAAAEQDRSVIVKSDKVLSVRDHDVTKFSLEPSVVLILNIPKEYHSGMIWL